MKKIALTFACISLCSVSVLVQASSMTNFCSSYGFFSRTPFKTCMLLQNDSNSPLVVIPQGYPTIHLPQKGINAALNEMTQYAGTNVTVSLPNGTIIFNDFVNNYNVLVCDDNMKCTSTPIPQDKSVRYTY